jgi:hypothetical protein
MGPLEGPHKREKVKQYLTRDFRGHKVGPYLVSRRAVKSALLGPLESPIGDLNRNPKGVHWGSSYPACQKAPSAPLGAPMGPPWVL